ncbi:MAG: ATP-binding protein [Acidobacteria bacterium]|nr:ATP-binding protein [Acidobacteriota bacterium]
MRFFNTEGPMKPDRHYSIPPLERVNLPEVLGLIEQERYFLLHAPRQTGKSSVMLALVKRLNSEGRYRAVCANIEGAQAMREDVAQATGAILAAIGRDANDQLKDPFPEARCEEVFTRGARPGDFGRLLAEWSARDPRPLVLFLDEVDALIGDTLLSVLRELRAGYPSRPTRFPQSVVLCGLRDIRDYRIHSSREKAVVTGGSAFNIKAESIRLGDFSKDDIRRLYLQHTAETGQAFEEPVFERVWELTQGQPWLVNALAQKVTMKMPEFEDRTRAVTVEAIEAAKESLIQGKVTHIDQLGHKLEEERVRRVVGPILAGGDFESNPLSDDVSYCIDLGLLRRGPAGLEPANPIYREVIPRYLNEGMVERLADKQSPAWYISPVDQRLDMPKLMTAFQQFFRENSEHWVGRFEYHESGPQLLLQAFLQRIVNGGGTIDREYGLGRGRTDLLVRWKWKGGEQRVVIELKVTRNPPTEKFLADGAAQAAGYMQRAGTSEGHLVVFDRGERSWDQKIFRQRREQDGYAIEVWGM